MHLGVEDATDELKRMQELAEVRKALEKGKRGKAGVTEDVPGDLIYGESVRLASAGRYFLMSIR